MLTLAQLKTNLRITGSENDTVLTNYLVFIRSYLESELGLDLAVYGLNTTKIFKNCYRMARYFPIECWSSITKIEIAKKQPVLVWNELTNYDQIEILESLNVKNTFTEVESLNCDFTNSLLRITGTYGFAPNSVNLPNQINELITQTAQSYLQFAKNGGSVVTSERSANLSISMDFSNVLGGLGVLNPKSNLDLARILKIYSTKIIYPYL